MGFVLKHFLYGIKGLFFSALGFQVVLVFWIFRVFLRALRVLKLLVHKGSVNGDRDLGGSCFFFRCFGVLGLLGFGSFRRCRGFYRV